MMQKYIEEMRDALARVINLIQNSDGGGQQSSSSRDEVLSTLERVLAHSHRLSFTTSAPPGYNPGKSFLYLTKPPAPQPAQLQSSILHSIQSTCTCIFDCVSLLLYSSANGIVFFSHIVIFVLHIDYVSPITCI